MVVSAKGKQMTDIKYRKTKPQELEPGLAIWFEGKNFNDTTLYHPYQGIGDQHPVCGPYLVERVSLTSIGPRVDLLNPSTGDRRSMMASWLLVPKEEK